MHRCRYLMVSVLLVTSLAISSDIGGVGTANPNSLAAGQVTLLTVAVTPGAEPASTGLAVSCDLSPIGGSAAQAFFDDGTNGDATANDNTFSYSATVNTSTIPGNKTLSCSITDAESRSASVSITLNITQELVTKACRSAGFWGTHAGTECPKKQPNCGSQNITQDVITAAGGCLAVCGQEVTNTTLNDANSAVEAICVSPSGDIELQLARQLTAATLNCVMSNSTATTSCSNGNCTTCGNLTVPGQDINIGTLVTACNDACIGSTATIPLGGVEVNCIDALNCFNNGGVFNAGTGPSTATCQTGRCSIDNSPCGIEGLPSCPTVIVGGIAQSQTCVPLPNNCESRPLCQVAIPGNATFGTPGTLCFDAINADVECPQPPAPAPAICTPAPGPAGSSNKCNSAIKNQCTIEVGCTTGNGATCPAVMTVTFNVTVPVSTDATGGSVYIAGSFNQWNRAFMTRVDATHWTITLPDLQETAIQYIYALEDWSHVEKDGNCQNIDNRQLNYNGNSTQIVNDVVLNWRNVAPCGD